MMLIMSVAAYGAGNPGEYLNWGAGARALGMGKAYTGVSEDGTAGYWNAGGMTQLKRSEVSLLRAILWEETNYDYAGFVYPTVSNGSFGLSIARLASGEGEARDENNIKSGSFRDIETAFILSYGYRVFKGLSVGGSIKKMDSELGSRVKGNMGLDISGMYSPFEGKEIRYVDTVRVGCNIQNVMSVKTGEESEDVLPVGVRVGGAVEAVGKKLLVSLDVENQLGSGIGLHIGGEYRFKYVAVRLGIESGEYSGGVGFSYLDYTLDWSYAMHDLGGSQRISAGYRFGQDVVRERERMAESYYEEGLYLAGEGEFEAGKKKFDRVLRYTSGKKYEVARERINEVVKNIRYSSGDEKEKVELRKGVVDYVKGEDQKALGEVLYAFSLNKGDESVYNLMRQMEKTSGLKAKQEEVSSGWSLVEQRLYKTLRYFRERKYDMAVSECQEAIKLEPKNALAHKRLGSAFYALGKKKEAKEAWEKALKYAPDDPGNEKLRSLINTIK